VPQDLDLPCSSFWNIDTTSQSGKIGATTAYPPIIVPWRLAWFVAACARISIDCLPRTAVSYIIYYPAYSCTERTGSLPHPINPPLLI
jgi:hypothetical protein